MSLDDDALRLIGSNKISKLGDLAKVLGYTVWWGPSDLAKATRGRVGAVLTRLQHRGLIYVCSKPHMIRLTARGRAALKESNV